MLTKEHQNARSKTCPNATFSTTNLTYTGLASTQGFRGKRPPEVWPCLLKTKVKVKVKFSCYRPKSALGDPVG